METANIYIYGDIGWWQSKDAADWGEITLSGVRDQYEAQKDAETITLHIHSPGGYVTEGFAIHDYIRSLGKPVTAIIEGMCYSIATVIALAGDKRIMTSNSDFMIHNPWGFAGGDSEEVQKYADQLKKEEQRVADFYAAKTSITSDEALELMKAETFMTPEQALEKGFITEIATVMKAVALYNPKAKKMSKKTLTKDEAESILDKAVNKIKSFFEDKPKNKLVQDANGEEIDFPDLEEDDIPAVGNKATINGAAAEGERVMPSGETYVFAAGVLTEIKPKEEETDPDTAALQSQVDDLQAKLKEEKKLTKALKKENGEIKSMVTELQKDIKAVKKSIGSNFKHDVDDPKNPKGSGSSRRVFKEKEEN